MIFKRTIISVLVLFMIGWIVRVGVPYLQSFKVSQELTEREEHIRLLLSDIYIYADTNNHEFPKTLSDINSSGRAYNITNYVYKKPINHSRGKIVEELIVAEKESSYPKQRTYFIGVKGNFVVRRMKGDYENMLIKSQVTESPTH